MGLFDRFWGRPPAPPPAPPASAPPAPPPAAPWPRPLFQPGGAAGHVDLWVFARDMPFPGGVLRLADEGHVDDALPAGLTLLGFAEADNPPAHAERLEALGPWLADLPPELEAAVRALPVHIRISGEVPDPPDLQHLQAAWAAARQACRGGGAWALDLPIATWRPAAELLAGPAADPRLAAAWRLLVNPHDLAPRVLIQSMGLIKVGRPELIAFVEPGQQDAALAVMSEVADGMLNGHRPATRQPYAHAGQGFVLEGYAPGFNGPDVGPMGPLQPLLVRLLGPVAE